MEKVLLIMPSPVNRISFINTMPPLGILYISSFLESKGIVADVIDCNVSDIDYSIANDYDFICFSVNCGNITNTLNMAKCIKEKYGKEIIVGGPQATSEPDFFLDKKYIDGVVIGEGEYTLYEYIKNKKLVKGIYLKDRNKKIIFEGGRPFIKDLDSLPFPAFNKIDITKYAVPIKKKKPISTILTSRGCPFNCIFCFHALGYRFRPRSAQNVVDEMEWQINNFGVREFCLGDDNISLDMDRAKKIFKGIIDKKFKAVLQLYNGIRADKIDEELLILMKKAKLWLMNVSPESGDLESIRLMKKEFDKEIVKKVIKMSKAMGFFTYSNFMVGFPWETEEHIRKTIDFAVELDTDITGFSRVTAFPGTKLYEMCKLDYKMDKDIGLFYSEPKFNISKLSNSRINKLIKEAYRRCYFRPSKIFRILKNLRLRDVYALVKYSLSTKSI